MKLLIDLDTDCCEQCDHLSRAGMCWLFRDRDGFLRAPLAGKDGKLVRVRQCLAAEKKARGR